MWKDDRPLQKGEKLHENSVDYFYDEDDGN